MQRLEDLGVTDLIVGFRNPYVESIDSQTLAQKLELLEGYAERVIARQRPAILLFDIDGTLLHAGGAGRRAVARVFGEHFARREVFDDVRAIRLLKMGV